MCCFFDTLVWYRNGVVAWTSALTVLIFLAHFSFFFHFFLYVHFSFSSLLVPLLPPIYPYFLLSYRPVDLCPLEQCNLACDVFYCACVKDARLQNFKAVFTRAHLFPTKSKFVVGLLNISARALRCCWPVTCLLKYIRQQMLLTSEYHVNYVEFQRLVGYFFSAGMQER